MHIRNVPGIDARYWVAIVAASMCGANSGDFVSESLGLGNLAGIPPLLILFGAIMLFERRSIRPTEAYYWTAIIVLRTVATNIADFAKQDLHLSYAAIELGLAVILVALVTAERLWLRGPRPVPIPGSAPVVPRTDAAYWAAMLTAGTLGTASGDFVEGGGGLGLGSGPASVAMGLVFLVVLATAISVGRLSKPWYWAAVVAARTAGTNLGDFLAGRHGLKLGLPTSLAVTAALLLGVLTLWRAEPPPAA